jgi:hypothetical protein
MWCCYPPFQAMPSDAGEPDYYDNSQACVPVPMYFAPMPQPDLSSMNMGMVSPMPMSMPMPMMAPYWMQPTPSTQQVHTHGASHPAYMHVQGSAQARAASLHNLTHSSPNVLRDSEHQVGMIAASCATVLKSDRLDG